MTVEGTTGGLEVPAYLMHYFNGVPQDRPWEPPQLAARAPSTTPDLPLTLTLFNIWTLAGVGLGPPALAFLLGASEKGVSVVFVFSLILAGIWYFSVDGIHRAAVQKARDLDAALADAQQQDYDARYRAWFETQPLRLLELSPFPHETSQILMGQIPGTIYLGVNPDTFLFATAARNQSVLILAPTQSGKTTGICDPTILAASGPVVATSTKTDTLFATYKARQALGMCWLYDPSGSVRDLPPGVRRAVWSPLMGALTWDDAILTATSLIEATSVAEARDAHWRERAEQWLAPLLFAAALHQDATMITVWQWVNRAEFVEPMTILEMVATNPSHPGAPGARIAQDELASIQRTQDRERDGIRSTLSVVLKVYRLESVQAAETDWNFDPAAFVNSDDTLYIVARSQNQQATAQLNATLIERIRHFVLLANEDDPFLENDLPPVLFMLDEMAHVAPLPQLPRYLGESLGQGAQFVVVLQTRAQARALWPNEEGSILDLFSVKVAFGGLTDRDTVEGLSLLSGDYDREYRTTSRSTTLGSSEGESTSRTRSRGDWGSTTHGTNTGRSSSITSGVSTSFHKERELTPADVAKVKPGQALVFVGNAWQLIDIVGTWSEPWAAVVRQTQHYLGPQVDLIGRDTDVPVAILSDDEDPPLICSDHPDLPPFAAPKPESTRPPAEQPSPSPSGLTPLTCPVCNGAGRPNGCPECDEVAA